MTVIICSEENHGFVGVAKDVKAGIKLLIKEFIESNWDDGLSEQVEEDLGKLVEGDWKEFLQSLSMEEFNNLFRDWLYLEPEKVYE